MMLLKILTNKLEISSIELYEHMSILMLRCMLPTLFELRKKRFCINKIMLDLVITITFGYIKLKFKL